MAQRKLCVNDRVHEVNPAWRKGGCLGCAQKYCQETAEGVPEGERTAERQKGYCVAFGKRCPPNDRCAGCRRVDVGELIPE
eukprot:1379580-Rhodomonas_salina.1